METIPGLFRVSHGHENFCGVGHHPYRHGGTMSELARLYSVAGHDPERWRAAGFFFACYPRPRQSPDRRSPTNKLG